MTINYYHQLIIQAAALLYPMNDLLKGNKNYPRPLDLGQDAERSFLAIKCQLVSLTRLTYQVSHAATVSSTDASTEAVGAVLQQDVARELWPVAFVRPLALAFLWRDTWLAS